MKDEKIRLQFDFTKEGVRQLDALKDRLNSPTRADAVRKGLRAADIFTQATQQGYQIILEKDGIRTLFPPVL